MHWTSGVTFVTALMGVAGCQAATTSVYHDAETGFTFSQYNAPYTLSESITFRIALPSPVTANSPYDIVLQVVAPVDVGWAGLAWGGSMLGNPLTVSWANGNTAVVSSRFATDHTLPPVYSGATYEVFKTGTHVNRTHWQFTAKCSGCTTFPGYNGRNTTLTPTGGNSLAFAYSASKPSNPSSSSSSFNVHSVTGYWTHDFSIAGNTAFNTLLTKDLGH